MDTECTSNIPNYFDRTPRKQWSIIKAYQIYRRELQPGANVFRIMENDLLEHKVKKKTAAGAVDNLLDELKLFEDQLTQTRSEPSRRVITGENNDSFTNCSNITKIVINTTRAKRVPCDDIGADEPATPTHIKRLKNSYNFVSSAVPLVVGTNSPRVRKDNPSDILDYFVVALSSSNDSIPAVVAQEYEQNMAEQEDLACLKRYPTVDKFLSKCLDCKWDNFTDYLDTAGASKHWLDQYGEEISDQDRRAIAMLRRILYDYHSNCLRPMFTPRCNERSPFTEHILPVLKYFGAWTGLVSFLWCELGSTAQKELPICLPDGQKKLLDGIGFDQSSLERILIERSGEKDGDHTEEDTLKIMECSHHCLKTEMDHLLYASWDTFTNRRILSIQCVSDKITLLSTRCLKTGKWCLVEVRSAIVPRDWRRRNSWARVMDLLFKLQELLVEQEEITAKLDREHTRRVYVDPNNTIQSRLRRLHNSPADEHLTD